MPKQLLSSAPLFQVKDLKKSLDFYCDVLGFERPTLWGDPPGFAMPQRDGLIIMLDQSKKVLTNKGNWDAYFWVKDAKGLFEEFQAKGAKFEYEIQLKELYGNLEFGLKDPDGYFLTFGQEYQERERDSHAIIPAPTSFKYTSPILPSADVARDIKWYAEKTGFVNVFNSSNYTEPISPLDYAVIGRQNHFLHLQWHAGTKEDPIHGNVVRIEVSNIRPLFEELVERGTVKAESFRKNTPWGTNEFGFFDLNKNAIFFLEDLKIT